MNSSRRPPEHVVRAARRGAADGLGEILRQKIPPPERPLGEDEVRRAYEEDDDRRTVRFPPHLRKLFASFSEDDAEHLKKLLLLRPETVKWIADKNERELKQLDGAVDFITSSRTAGKWLVWIGGSAVAFVAGVTALAKNGYDLFSLLRGGR